MKPRIIKIDCRPGWLCQGRGVSAAGSTPERAYGLWMFRYLVNTYRRINDGV